MNPVESQLGRMGLTLPPPAKPAGSYVPWVRAGNMVYVSGQISRRLDGTVIAGRVGQDLSLEGGRDAARQAAIHALGAIRDSAGFEAFDRMIRVTGFVQVSCGFTRIADVVNGASELFLEVFGGKGEHARTSVGVAGLPLDAAVEIEIIFQIRA